MGRACCRPSANDTCLKLDFFVCAPAWTGLVAGQALAICRPSANDTCLKLDFLHAPLPGLGLLPVRPSPSANAPCLKCGFCLCPCLDWACYRSGPCHLQPGLGLLPVRALPSANDPCLTWDFCMCLCLAWAGLLSGEALAICKRPLPDMRFLHVPLPGLGGLVAGRGPSHLQATLACSESLAGTAALRRRPKSVLKRLFSETRFVLAPLQGCLGPPPRYHTKTLGTKP